MLPLLPAQIGRQLIAQRADTALVRSIAVSK